MTIQNNCTGGGLRLTLRRSTAPPFIDSGTIVEDVVPSAAQFFRTLRPPNDLYGDVVGPTRQPRCAEVDIQNSGGCAR